MKIVDFEKKGQTVRFYLSNVEEDYYGDDWDDAPYEHNAGPVYSRFVDGYIDVTFPFDDLVLEPSDGVLNSAYNKNAMKKRIVPCIIVVPSEKVDFFEDFAYYVGMDEIQKYYFGDEMEPEVLGAPPTLY